MGIRRVFWIIFLCAPGVQQAPSQGSAGSSGAVEPRFLVDAPIAGMIYRGSLAVDTDFYQDGGVVLGFTVGVFDRLNLGVSYGGSNLLGNGRAVMNPVPGVNVKIRVFEEGSVIPAIAIGFDSQGRDGYIKELDRYINKSSGLFAVVSKNYAIVGFLSVHGGVNYTFERSDQDRDINFFAGIEKTIGSSISVVLEYNLGVNDDEGQAVGRGTGYLHAALKWSMGAGFTIAANFKDLTKNSGVVSGVNRTVRVEYVRAF